MTKTETSEEAISAWIGKSETNHDLIDLRQARLMQTIMPERENSGGLSVGDELPPLWHWLYFPTTADLDQLGADGHPRLGGFLPPIKLPRRMWAGGRLRFLRPLRIGDRVERKSTIKNIAAKTGKSGSLCFVTVVHEYLVSGKVSVVEEHDIVYRENALQGSVPPIPPAAPEHSDWSRVVIPGPVMLFRYSALTFNGHRIHYDRQYCKDVEGLEGLVFHGPLTATLLIDLAVQENPGKRLASFEFRAISPLFDDRQFIIAGQDKDDRSTLWAQNPDGRLAMTGEAVFG